MFRIWGKLVKNSKIIKSMTVENPGDDTRTHKIFAAIEEMCREWDLMNPIWLDSSIEDFKRRSSVRFYKESFIEDIEFDYMEIRVLEEED